ncbi:hypothetical protein IGI39_002963 [Enterococcus sp. AZ135]|uniref:HAD family hydrolase n=1 Tax=unclassified Enterococcus TaxID=2608891 RepID=UPI003F2734A6
MIKAIVFDLDDTLYRQELPVIAAIKTVFPQLMEKDLSKFYKLFRTISDQLYEQTKQKNKNSMLEVNRLRLAKTMETSFGLKISDDLVVSFESEYIQQLNQICLAIPLRNVLKKLTKTYKLGIISNGYPQRQELKLEALKIKEVIPNKKILISGKVGIEKPDRRIFDRMAQILTIHETREIIYVGDNYKNDVMGAKQAGWKTWWFNHQQRPIPEGEIKMYDKEVRSFDDLISELSLLL